MKGSNKMNKSLLLASMMVVALAACGKKEPTPPPAPTPAPAPAPAPAPTPAPTPAPSTSSTAPADAMKADPMKMDTMKKASNPVEDANKAAAGTAVDAANKKQPAVKP